MGGLLPGAEASQSGLCELVSGSAEGVRMVTCQILCWILFFFWGGAAVCLLTFLQLLVDVGFLRSEGAEHAEGVACLTVCCLAADCWLAQVFLDGPGAWRGPQAGLFGQSGVVSGVLGWGGPLGRECRCEDGAGGVWLTGGGGGVERLRLEPLVELVRDLQLGLMPPLVLTRVSVRRLQQAEVGALRPLHVIIKHGAAVV